MMRMVSCLGIMILLALSAAVGQAGTIVWDFDGATAGLEAGAIDGDTHTPEGFRPNPTQVNVGLSASNFNVENGRLIQTYAELPTGEVPTTDASYIHCTGVIVGDLRGVYPGATTPTLLNLTNIETDYPYLMLGGIHEWAPAGGDVGMILFPVTTEAAAWFTNSLRLSNVVTNTYGRQVFDLTTSIRTGSYSGTLQGIMFDFYGMWTAAVDPTFMKAKWESEFNPATTRVELDWVALTDDPDFRASYVPVELSRFTLE
ncbi:MAG TPA: hypothetical protein PK847_00865 [Candidatus Sumerlaeota bacterium]|nr:hypothetical protein [Candidatus Sumerlaeota bacterium]